MQTLRRSLLAALVVEYGLAQNLREQYPWYHTGDEIHSELASFAGNCLDAQFNITSVAVAANEPQSDVNVKLDVIHVSKGTSQHKIKAFFVFGEHARELISTESALTLLRELCGHSMSTDQDLVRRVLEKTDFIIVPNANPLSRARVEAGEYCKRANEDGVDLNRNWGTEHHAEWDGKDPEMNPGSHGFSEPETKIINELVLDEKPDVFLSVHSGAFLLGTPFGYSSSQRADNQQGMMDVLQPISEQFCNGNCPYGDLAGLIGYTAKGCDIDYVKESLHVPYAFTWEIYAGQEVRDMYAEEAHARAENRTMRQPARSFFHAEESLGLLQTSTSRRFRGTRSGALDPDSQKALDDCFWQFNPETQEETTAVTQNWAAAYLTLCDKVAMSTLHEK
eukprot:gnl/MRDRNA2_/MRDRNA2_143715_c0_seq1.p1 gnl/MRDRNA2_/MRDRNA2_143715_c0~~gnl/MRDRNA2_/MRDRNA2_143715_c0_seq1.p1  ORF type:complete len:393 (+),score=70.14 gnl/MRDRNA2_/MRDRNA2_143715_c0_seq1:189-1367(+)